MYHITRGEVIVAVDLTAETDEGNFVAEILGAAPPTFTNPFMCAFLEIDGEPGGS